MRNADALGLDDLQRARVTEAYRMERGTKWDRYNASVEAKAVNAEIAGHYEAVLAQAKARGEKVVAYNAAGAHRIKTHDGLAALFDSGALSEEELNTGLVYRLLYEEAAADGGVGSQLEDRVRAPACSSHGAVAAGLLRAYAGVRLTGVERAVQNADRGGQTLIVLRAVAGEGRTVRSLASSGGARLSATSRLKRALLIVAAALRGNGGLANQGP
jgi:hypothetical protein